MGNDIGFKLLGDAAEITMIQSAKKNADDACTSYGDGAKSGYWFWDKYCYRNGEKVGVKVYTAGKKKSKKYKTKHYKTKYNKRI